MIEKRKVVEYDVENFHLAEVRYLDLENCRFLSGDEVWYAFLVNKDSVYMDLFCCLSDMPVFKLKPSANSMEGEENDDFELVVAGNECFVGSGPCYVLCDIDLKEIFGKDKVRQEDIENYILASDKFFIERKSIAKERMEISPAKMERILDNDKENEAKYIQFFQERGVQLQKK